MRNQNKQRYLIRYLSIFALLFAVVIVKTSCNKLDTGFQTNLHPANFTEQFFTTKTTPSSQTANLIQKLKDENANNSFVANLPKNCGLPIWEKVVFRKQAQDHNEDFSLYSPATHGPSANFDLTGDSSELAVIPLTITDSALSSVLLVKDENGTITTTCITTNGNLYDVVHGTNITLATEQLVLFFYMENETYGTDKFYHIPTTLFPQSTQVGTDGKKIITLSDNDSTSTETSSFRFCKKILVLCECGQYPCPVGNSYEYEVCVTINPPNGGGTGGTGTGGTGTGGTGTGGTGTGGTGGGGGGGTGTGGGGNGGNTNCNDPFYSNFGPCGPPPPPNQEQLDLLWMNSNIIDSTNDPCITSSIATLKQISPKLPRLIRDFFSANPNFKMRFNTYVTTQPSCNGSNFCEPEGANTDPVPYNGNIFVISINKYYANATDLSTAATIIHEALHTQLIQWLRQAVVQQDTAMQHQLAALYGYVFTPDFNYNANVYQTALQLTTQHEAMALLYKNLVAQALYVFAQHKGISVTQSQCDKLAWAGLNTTEAFNRLPTSDKDLITEMINAERDPNGTSVNDNGSGGTIRTAFGTPCY